MAGPITTNIASRPSMVAAVQQRVASVREFGLPLINNIFTEVRLKLEGSKRFKIR